MNADRSPSPSFALSFAESTTDATQIYHHDDARVDEYDSKRDLSRSPSRGRSRSRGPSRSHSRARSLSRTKRSREAPS
ncbi:hypothetical protein LINPERHAP1_LOCUS15812 [Linum perenne]